MAACYAVLLLLLVPPFGSAGSRREGWEQEGGWESRSVESEICRQIR